MQGGFHLSHYFKGWYFKVQNDRQIAAFIPAMHSETNGKRSASLQIITEAGAQCVWFPFAQFNCGKNEPWVKIGDNIFTSHGLTLNVKTDTVTAQGALTFGPLTPLAYDIMGPFRYLPGIECRHSVFSMTHTVYGAFTINDRCYQFDGDVGYLEGDRGRSFPQFYAWTQANFFDQTANSLMLSVAEIPFGPLRFTGVIGAIRYHGTEYRLGTYLGAKAEKIKDETLVIRQGKFKFTANLIDKQNNLLYAPVLGNMERMIHESLRCNAYYRLEENKNILFELETDRASFEYEYDR